MDVSVWIYVLCNGLQDQGLNIIRQQHSAQHIYIYSCFVDENNVLLFYPHIFPINCCCSCCSCCALYSILSGLLSSWLDVGLLLAPGWWLSSITLHKTLNDVDGGNAINSSDVFCMKQNIRLEWVYILWYIKIHITARLDGYTQIKEAGITNRKKSLIKNDVEDYFYAIRDCRVE